MKSNQIRRAVIREWMELPRDKRQTEQQTAGFVEKAVQHHKLPRGNDEPYQVMMRWLLTRTGRP